MYKNTMRLGKGGLGRNKKTENSPEGEETFLLIYG